ncbi:hypothetical protein [Streptomyces sp. NPDC005953]
MMRNNAENLEAYLSVLSKGAVPLVIPASLNRSFSRASTQKLQQVHYRWA